MITRPRQCRWQSLLLLFLPLLTCVFPSRAHAQQENAWLLAHTPPNTGIWLESLGVQDVVQQYGQAQIGRTVLGHPMTLHGVIYPHGIATHANGEMRIDLHGAVLRFIALVGVDDEVIPYGSVTFTVLVDGRRQAYSGLMHGGDLPKVISVDLTGAKSLVLRVNDGGDGNAYDHADWADATLILAPNATSRPTTAPLVGPWPKARLGTPEPDASGSSVWIFPLSFFVVVGMVAFAFFRRK